LNGRSPPHGNNCECLRLNSVTSGRGRDADVVVIDACAGGSQDNALDALRNGISRPWRRWLSTACPICRAQPEYARFDQNVRVRTASCRGISPVVCI